MKWLKNGRYYQLRLVRGEEIQAALAAFVRRARLKSGALIGLGAARDIELGYYNLHRREYVRRRFRGEHELAALVGNVAWDGKEPVCHVHAVISDKKCATFSGHLFRATVAATCEVSVLPGTRRLVRRVEPDTGLKLLQL
jgi:predicted DNA-binding protein with PD1-like motif